MKADRSDALGTASRRERNDARRFQWNGRKAIPSSARRFGAHPPDKWWDSLPIRTAITVNR